MQKTGAQIWAEITQSNIEVLECARKAERALHGVREFTKPEDFSMTEEQYLMQVRDRLRDAVDRQNKLVNAVYSACDE